MPSGKQKVTQKKKVEYFDRDPYPILLQGNLLTGVSAPLAYKNGMKENTELKELQIRAPPLCTITIERTEDGNTHTVVPTMRISDIPYFNGWRRLKLREVERDVPLTVKRDQTLTVTLTNMYSFTIIYRAILNKNQVVFYEPVVASAKVSA